ncbi:MAG: thermonuclease family protein [Methanomicrobiales archaeon]|jgi:micrococcal nuclease|nr:thermonuclease family protein [Methanomicrobiales archaeon]
MNKIVLYLLLCLALVSCITTAGCLGYFDFHESSVELLSSDSSVFLFEGKVTHVGDGDTITVELSDKTRERIRLIGIDTPEMDASQNSAREYGSLSQDHLAEWAKKAKDFTTEQLLYDTVTISYDPAAGERDRYDRVLGYVTSDGRDFNQVLIEEGYARVYIAETFDRKQDYIDALETAQKYKIGMWNE